jgi:hypothetical protein
MIVFEEAFKPTAQMDILKDFADGLDRDIDNLNLKWENIKSQALHDPTMFYPMVDQGLQKIHKETHRALSVARDSLDNLYNIVKRFEIKNQH